MSACEPANMAYQECVSPVTRGESGPGPSLATGRGGARYGGLGLWAGCHVSCYSSNTLTRPHASTEGDGVVFCVDWKVLFVGLDCEK